MIKLSPDGRTNLDKIEVNPAVFLQLYAELKKEKGKLVSDRINFNERQLLIAFNRYLHNSKGLWTRNEIRGITDYHKFARDYVAAEMKKFDAFQRKQSTSAAPLSAKQRKAKKFLDDRGLSLLDKKDMPIKSSKNDADNTGTNRDTAKVEKAMDTTEIAVQLFEIAQSASPGVAVAAVLLTNTLLPNFSTMALRGTEILLDKYENRSKTKQEKDTVLHGLEIVTARLQPSTFAARLTQLQQKESKTSDTKPEYLLRLEKLKNRPEEPLENRLEQRVAAFRDNRDTYEDSRESPEPAPVIAAHRPAKPHNPFSAPKPPTEAIFYDARYASGDEDSDEHFRR